MSQAAQQLLEMALRLPDEDQLNLLSALVSAVEERGLRPFDDDYMAEIQRRSAEFDAGNVTAIPWVEVRERARQKLNPCG
jgi:putative addiction module component (TIGR02574 family)